MDKFSLNISPHTYIIKVFQAHQHEINLNLVNLAQCDRTTSEMRGSSPKIISGDSRRSENAQTHTYKHIVLNMKFKLKLLQIKCHVL
jgi:hypothetical protein